MKLASSMRACASYFYWIRSLKICLWFIKFFDVLECRVADKSSDFGEGDVAYS